MGRTSKPGNTTTSDASDHPATAGSTGGRTFRYPFRAIGASADTQCPVCRDSWVRPITCLPCEHTFCRDCVALRARCPECKKTIASFREPHRDVKALSDSVTVECLDCHVTMLRGASYTHQCLPSVVKDDAADTEDQQRSPVLHRDSTVVGSPVQRDNDDAADSNGTMQRVAVQIGDLTKYPRIAYFCCSEECLTHPRTSLGYLVPLRRRGSEWRVERADALANNTDEARYAVLCDSCRKADLSPASNVDGLIAGDALISMNDDRTCSLDPQSHANTCDGMPLNAQGCEHCFCVAHLTSALRGAVKQISAGDPRRLVQQSFRHANVFQWGLRCPICVLLGRPVELRGLLPLPLIRNLLPPSRSDADGPSPPPDNVDASPGDTGHEIVQADATPPTAAVSSAAISAVVAAPDATTNGSTIITGALSARLLSNLFVPCGSCGYPLPCPDALFDEDGPASADGAPSLRQPCPCCGTMRCTTCGEAVHGTADCPGLHTLPHEILRRLLERKGASHVEMFFASRILYLVWDVKQVQAGGLRHTALMDDRSLRQFLRAVAAVAGLAGSDGLARAIWGSSLSLLPSALEWEHLIMAAQAAARMAELNAASPHRH